MHSALGRSRIGVALLALFLLINFWDRGALGFAAVPMMRDLGLSHAQFGALGSAFFLLFSLSALAFGWLGDRCSLRKLIAAMACIWSVAQGLMAASGTFAPALASRTLLGAGEGGAFPTALHAAFRWFPRERHPSIAGAIASGGPLGLASGALLITGAISAWGWHAAFAALSCASLIWALFWLASRQGDEREAELPPTFRDSNGAPKWFDPTMLGATVTAFGVYWVFAVATYWFPAAMQTADGFSPAASAVVLSFAWLVQIPFFSAAASGAALLQSRGYSNALALSTVASIGVAIAGVALVVNGLSENRVLVSSTVLVCLASVALAVPILPALVDSLTPQGSRSMAMGSFIGVASLAGLVAPAFFGAVTDLAGKQGGYGAALIASGVVTIVTAPAAFVAARHRAPKLLF